jgi:hypothetical protein
MYPVVSARFKDVNPAIHLSLSNFPQFLEFSLPISRQPCLK